MSAANPRNVPGVGPAVAGLRLPAFAYLVGMFLVFLGERLFGGEATARWVLDGLGLLMVLGAMGLQARGMAAAPAAQRGAHRLALLGTGAGLASLAVYALGTNGVVNAIGFADETAEHRYEVVVSALWPILWLAGTLPMLAVERVLAANPVMVAPARARDAATGALGLGLAVAMLFPLNYLAAELNHRWDFGYFKTARAGEAVRNMVGGLEEPITAYLFFPTSSEVTDELRTYFGELEGGGLQVEYVDHALEPELARELKVRDNGYIAFARGEGDEQQVERIKIGEDFDAAKRKLKKLDQEVREVLFKMARGKRTAYFTAGHGEMDADSGTEVMRRTSNLKKVLRALNYNVKTLSLADGLASDVPDDADLVFVLGPESDFLPEELASLDRFRQRGGAMLLALEPGGPDMADLLGPMGLRYDPAATLANESKFVPLTYRPVDRANLATNKYSTHPSVTTLSRNSEAMVLIVPGAGQLEEAPGGEGKTTATIRAFGDTWGDRDLDFEFDADTEKRQTYTLAAASSGPATAPADADPADAGPEEYRVVVMADATWASDAALPLDVNKANFQYVLDAVGWLGGEEDFQGSVESEEDVKIQHTREGQGWIFYSTAFVVPFAFLGLGLGRIRIRRKGGAA